MMLSFIKGVLRDIRVNAIDLFRRHCVRIEVKEEADEHYFITVFICGINIGGTIFTKESILPYVQENA